MLRFLKFILRTEKDIFYSLTRIVSEHFSILIW